MKMKHFILLIFASLQWRCSFAETIITFDWNVPIGVIAYYKNYFVARASNDKKIIFFNETGEIVKEMGGKGKGPGEFEGLLTANVIDDNLIAVDYMLYRGTVYNLLNDDVFTYRIKPINRYCWGIHKKNDKLYHIGLFPANPFDPMKEYYLLDIYQLQNCEATHIGTEVRIEQDLKNFKIHNSNKITKTSSYVTPVPPVFTVSNNKLFIAHAFLPYIIKFGTDSHKMEKIAVDFPSYVNPHKINLEREHKKYLAKYNDQNVSLANYTFRPIYMSYLEDFDRVYIYYQIPLQLKNKHNNNRFIEVVFDSSFDFIEKRYLNSYPFIYKKDNEYKILLRENINDEISNQFRCKTLIEK